MNNQSTPTPGNTSTGSQNRSAETQDQTGTTKTKPEPWFKTRIAGLEQQLAAAQLGGSNPLSGIEPTGLIALFSEYLRNENVSSAFSLKRRYDDGAGNYWEVTTRDGLIYHTEIKGQYAAERAKSEVRALESQIAGLVADERAATREARNYHEQVGRLKKEAEDRGEELADDAPQLIIEKDARDLEAAFLRKASAARASREEMEAEVKALREVIDTCIEKVRTFPARLKDLAL